MDGEGVGVEGWRVSALFDPRVRCLLRKEMRAGWDTHGYAVILPRGETRWCGTAWMVWWSHQEVMQIQTDERGTVWSGETDMHHHSHSCDV